MSSTSFFRQPILNSPYDYPARHWELDGRGQPTETVVGRRRRADFITPIPPAQKQKRAEQAQIDFADETGVGSAGQRYAQVRVINELRRAVDDWRAVPDPSKWRVTPETQRLLRHWRHHPFQDLRPFFCQVEAAEVAIWLTEVAPSIGAEGRRFLDYLGDANAGANPGVDRLALKLATGAGKTTVMAMLIAWQTLNAVRRPGSRRFTRGFLVVAPGLTIKDRLRVLQPNDPDAYYADRELVPADMLDDLRKARIVITNYHAFKPREKIELASGTRAMLRGRGPELNTIETSGQMLQRVMPELMGMKDIVVLNDEGHHCYREKPGDSDEGKLVGDDRVEAKENEEAARLWIGGIEAVREKLGVARVFDLSATPFFLRGSGYAEGTLFPWTMSDFSLMDAIECGIVKLPRVPIADNIPGADVPQYRELWKHVGKGLPKKGARNAGKLDPLSLPAKLETALLALYGHYETTFNEWQKADIAVPPCFIVVANNTATSKLIYDFVSGFRDEADRFHNGRLPLFRNFDGDGNPHPRPRTLLIDSHQLESGDALDKEFRDAAAGEIERFRREIIERTGNRQEAENLTDQDLLREVMNTVGKRGRLGADIRCVVSVSMLTEGWDSNTVTHVLGVRAFGTQLLCEQVVGRALRRQSYDLNADGLFNPEYADVLGIPFDFNAEPTVAPVQPPRKVVTVRAVSPERDALEITFPRVAGYRVELPDTVLRADFDADSTLELTPDMVGATHVVNSGIIGERADINLEHLASVRKSTVLFHVTRRLLERHWREPGGDLPYNLFGQLKRVAKQWMDQHLVCKGGTYPAQLMYQELADRACRKITDAVTRRHQGDKRIKAMPDAYNPRGSTANVRFTTSKTDLWTPRPDRCHLNLLVMDSDWEAEFCRVAEKHPRVLAYVKNHNLGFEVPYRLGGEMRLYRPDFIVLIDDGHGPADPLQLVVEIKGYRGEDAKEKKSTMDTYWVPGVNHLGTHGRWAFAEFTDVWGIGAEFEAKVNKQFDEMIDSATDSKEVA